MDREKLSAACAAIEAFPCVTIMSETVQQFSMCAGR